MPQQAFVVLLESDNEIDNNQTIDDMNDALTSVGFRVININPWGPDQKSAAPALGLAQSLLGLGQPKPTTQQ